MTDKLHCPDGYYQFTLRIPENLVRMLEREYDMQRSNKQRLFLQMIRFAFCHLEFDVETEYTILEHVADLEHRVQQLEAVLPLVDLEQ